MSIGKHTKWAEMHTFPNVLEPYTEDHFSSLDGAWSPDHFGNTNPLILELACGHGEYALALAQRYPGYNVVGVDKKGARMWQGAKKALEQEITNVAFLRIFIEHLPDHFAEEEVDTIWITFPDPFPKEKHAKKRLTAPRFLNDYRRLLRPAGKVHLKTDNDQLFAYTQETVLEAGGTLEEVYYDIEQAIEPEPLLQVQTAYEKQHRVEGRTIKYLRFRF